MGTEGRARFRRRAGLTLFELARRIGKSAGTLSLWERGKLELSREDVARIAIVIHGEIARVPQPDTPEGIARELFDLVVRG